MKEGGEAGEGTWQYRSGDAEMVISVGCARIRIVCPIVLGKVLNGLCSVDLLSDEMRRYTSEYSFSLGYCSVPYDKACQI